MLINFYRYDDDERRVDKSNKIFITTKDMNPVDGVNLLTPTFTVDYDTDLLSANYAEINGNPPTRYYFVSPPTLIKGGRLSFDFRVDVTQIPGFLTIVGTIKRNEFMKNAPIADDMYPVKEGQQDLRTLWLQLNRQKYISYIEGDIYGMFDYLLTK